MLVLLVDYFVFCEVCQTVASNLFDGLIFTYFVFNAEYAIFAKEILNTICITVLVKCTVATLT